MNQRHGYRIASSFLGKNAGKNFQRYETLMLMHLLLKTTGTTIFDD